MYFQAMILTESNLAIINQLIKGISKKRNTKTALVLKTEVEDNENVESSYHKRNSKMMQGAIGIIFRDF